MLKNQTNNSVTFISVKEAAQILQSSTGSVYVYLCKSKNRKQFPQRIYRKFGRRVLFIKEELIQWIVDGAELE